MPLSAELEKIWLISGRKIRLRRKKWLNQENSSKFGLNEGIFHHFQKLEKCHKNPVFEKPGLETPPLKHKIQFEIPDFFLISPVL